MRRTTCAKKPAPSVKLELHPRNRHRGAYDFPQLILAEPALAPFVAANRHGTPSIDFANPAAVKTLNRALLRYFYGVANWDIPAQYLCPPIPGRADYLHYLADLLAVNNGGVIPQGDSIRVLDIGVGANLVYPLIGQHEYGWQFVGADIDRIAMANAARIVAANVDVGNAIALRWQKTPAQVFAGVIEPEDRFDLTLCNPPFHASLAEAQAGTARKLRGLAVSAGKSAGKVATRQVQSPRAQSENPALNFGGQAAELYCAGGEAAFINRMIAESTQFATQVLWFTSLVSKSDSLPGVYRALKQADVRASKTTAMAQGQKQSRFVAWSFLDQEQQIEWRRLQWCRVQK